MTLTIVAHNQRLLSASRPLWNYTDVLEKSHASSVADVPAQSSLDDVARTLAELQIVVQALSKAEQTDDKVSDVPGVSDGRLECIDGKCAVLDMLDLLKEQMTQVAQQQHPELQVTSPTPSDDNIGTGAVKIMILPILLPSFIFFGLVIIYLVYRLTMRKTFYHQPYWHPDQEQCRPSHSLKERLAMAVGLRSYRADIETATQEKGALFVVDNDEAASDSVSDSESEKESPEKLQAEIVGLRQAHTIVTALVSQAARSVQSRGRLSLRALSRSESEVLPGYRSRTSTLADSILDAPPSYEGSDMSPFPALDMSSTSHSSSRSRGSSVQSRTTDCSSLDSSVYALSRRESCNTDLDSWQGETSMCGLPWA